MAPDTFSDLGHRGEQTEAHKNGAEQFWTHLRLERPRSSGGATPVP